MVSCYGGSGDAADRLQRIPLAPRAIDDERIRRRRRPQRQNGCGPRPDPPQRPALRRGAPEGKLVVDGLVGPRTIEAIRRYQQAHTKVADGRVDVGSPTIKALVRALNARNILPGSLPNLGR